MQRCYSEWGKVNWDCAVSRKLMTPLGPASSIHSEGVGWRGPALCALWPSPAQSKGGWPRPSGLTLQAHPRVCFSSAGKRCPCAGQIWTHLEAVFHRQVTKWTVVDPSATWDRHGHLGISRSQVVRDGLQCHCCMMYVHESPSDGMPWGWGERMGSCCKQGHERTSRWLVPCWNLDVHL